jgi:hypothetical protein
VTEAAPASEAASAIDGVAEALLKTRRGGIRKALTVIS